MYTEFLELPNINKSLYFPLTQNEKAVRVAFDEYNCTMQLPDTTEVSYTFLPYFTNLKF